MRCLLEVQSIFHTDWPSLMKEAAFVCIHCPIHVQVLILIPNQVMYKTPIRTKLDRWIPLSIEEDRSVGEYLNKNKKSQIFL